MIKTPPSWGAISGWAKSNSRRRSTTSSRSQVASDRKNWSRWTGASCAWVTGSAPASAVSVLLRRVPLWAGHEQPRQILTEGAALGEGGEAFIRLGGELLQGTGRRGSGDSRRHPTYLHRCSTLSRLGSTNYQYMPIGQDEAFATHQVRIYADPETVVRMD